MVFLCMHVLPVPEWVLSGLSGFLIHWVLLLGVEGGWMVVMVHNGAKAKYFRFLSLQRQMQVGVRPSTRVDVFTFLVFMKGSDSNQATRVVGARFLKRASLYTRTGVYWRVLVCIPAHSGAVAALHLAAGYIIMTKK